MSPYQVSDFLDSLRSLLSELEALTIPTIAVVDGFALGGGTELALGCDIRVGGKSSLCPRYASCRPNTLVDLKLVLLILFESSKHADFQEWEQRWLYPR